MRAWVFVVQTSSGSADANARLDYKQLKASDVIGTLVSLFETKDVFVKEFQVTLGSRLLKNDLDLDREASLSLCVRFEDC